MKPFTLQSRYAARLAVILALTLFAGLAVSSLVPMTLIDFHLSGTQVGHVSTDIYRSTNECKLCHGLFNEVTEPHATWSGSLMGNAGRDPLFFAQMSTANQDVANVGYFCMRCHVPVTFVTGHAYDVDGSTLDETDREGVSCHFCHTMVDPIYKPGVNPPQDARILAALDSVPAFYGNSMFVLDPSGRRRGPRTDAEPGHTMVPSPFHRTGEFCGTCHDVGNVAVTRQVDGTYRYNALDQATPTEDLAHQFPLERTYTEWKLSAFANGGVDMGGRFGGVGASLIETCQDCHMPRVVGQACYFGPERQDLAQHDFAGASVWVLDIIQEYYRNDPNIDTLAIAAGMDKAVSMLQRAASLDLAQEGGVLHVRVINESGHKLPTGHIEGRRVWLNVQMLDAQELILREYGRYDFEEAILDEPDTVIYEMHVGLSETAASATGYPAGVTTHMALADTIEKDTRIPPRGFQNASYAAAGAPAVGIAYADGQYWDDVYFRVPDGTMSARVTLNYQTVTRHYIEALRNANVTDHWGETLHDLWLTTEKGAPIPMAGADAALGPFRRGDMDHDSDLDRSDFAAFVPCAEVRDRYHASACPHLDFDDDGDSDLFDFAEFQREFGSW